ncbi:hypothetical protein HUJ05_006625 [Dendroctonus ponderosae]|nr:hypothetical protein HUJ05_006625 [Dendroctonus ponderosae]
MSHNALRLVFFTIEVIVGRVTSSCEYITLSTPFSSFEVGGGAWTPPGIRNTVKKNIKEPKIRTNSRANCNSDKTFILAEMWFGILFAILVEIVPLHVRSTTVGVFLFVMNNIGGNLPIAVEPVSKAIGYRESLYIFYVAFYLISSLMFFFTVFLMPGGVQAPPPTSKELNGVDNVMYSHDEVTLPTITSMVKNTKRTGTESSRLALQV